MRINIAEIFPCQTQCKVVEIAQLFDELQRRLTGYQLATYYMRIEIERCSSERSQMNFDLAALFKTFAYVAPLLINRILVLT